jgi:hypothetical protein
MENLSRTLGTICLEAPIDTDISSYIPSAPDTKEAVRILTSLEMFRMIEKFSLDEESLTEREKNRKYSVCQRYV